MADNLLFYGDNLFSPWATEMSTSVGLYHVVLFDSYAEASKQAQRIMDALERWPGKAFEDGPIPAVIWLEGPPAPQPALYLSEGAFLAAETSAISLSVDRQVHRRDIPAGCSLLLGDATDQTWHDGQIQE